MVHLERRCIYMEYIEDGTVLKDFIDKNVSDGSNVDQLNFIAKGLGTLIARLHSKNIIHGDLTTSNVLLKNTDKLKIEKGDGNNCSPIIIIQFNSCSVFIFGPSFPAVNNFIMIDFGLARTESSVEDKAVDLYVLERSLLSAHSEVPSLFSEIFNTYQKCYMNKNQCKEIVSKYKEVQARGRKRLMIG